MAHLQAHGLYSQNILVQYNDDQEAALTILKMPPNAHLPAKDRPRRQCQILGPPVRQPRVENDDGASDREAGLESGEEDEVEAEDIDLPGAMEHRLLLAALNLDPNRIDREATKKRRPGEHS